MIYIYIKNLNHYRFVPVCARILTHNYNTLVSVGATVR